MIHLVRCDIERGLPSGGPENKLECIVDVEPQLTGDVRRYVLTVGRWAFAVSAHSSPLVSWDKDKERPFVWEGYIKDYLLNLKIFKTSEEFVVTKSAYNLQKSHYSTLVSGVE